MLMKFERRKPSILVSKGARDAPGSSGPVPIAGNRSGVSGSSDPVSIVGDCGGVAGSSDPVSTAARRGDGSHSDDWLFSRARCSPIIPSGCTEVSVRS